MSDFLSLPKWIQQAFRKDARWGYMAYRLEEEVPQVFTYSGEFTSTSDNQSPIVLEPDQAIPADMYIQQLGYDVMRPNFAPGSVFAAESNLANAQQPGIKILMEVGGGFLGDQYNINIGLSNIQMVIPNVRQLWQANCPWPGKWHMTYSQQLVVNCFLNRDLGETEVPYQIEISLFAKRPNCAGWGRMTVQDVTQRMADEWGVHNLPKTLALKPEVEIVNDVIQSVGRNPHSTVQLLQPRGVHSALGSRR